VCGSITNEKAACLLARNSNSSSYPSDLFSSVPNGPFSHLFTLHLKGEGHLKLTFLSIHSCRSIQRPLDTFFYYLRSKWCDCMIKMDFRTCSEDSINHYLALSIIWDTKNGLINVMLFTEALDLYRGKIPL
jgi:hypothetical protein